MRLAQYSDDELIEELKHRGIKIELPYTKKPQIRIGGVLFDIRT